MFGFLLSRRWIGLFLAVVVVGAACVLLGRWQLDRYQERQDTNHVAEANLDADPVPVSDLLSVEAETSKDDEWRAVEATGQYDVENQIIVLYRSKDGASGVDVVVPLVTSDGTALLVDRGWVASEGNRQTPDVPAPPHGTVTVTGWTRVDAEGDADEVTPVDGQVRAISADAIAPTLPYDVYDGFVDLTSEDPSVEPAPQRADRPDLGSGPHFFYGIQWFFFGLLALAFFGYFGWSEYRRRQQTTDPDHPEVSTHPGPPSEQGVSATHGRREP